MKAIISDASIRGSSAQTIPIRDGRISNVDASHSSRTVGYAYAVELTLVVLVVKLILLVL
jgi:hypothetical protein